MIAFVALGEFPPWLGDALAQARLANPAARIVLLHDRDASQWRVRARALAVDLVDVPGLGPDPRLREFYGRGDSRRRFRDGFWVHTTARFIALRLFMEHARIDALTHLENDVMLYAPLDALAGWAPCAGPAIAAVFENGSRAIPGVVHVGSRDSLDRFVDFVMAEPAGHASDDMHRLAAFRRARPAAVVDLPTVPPGHGARSAAVRSLFSGEEEAVPMAPGRWMFDGARFGQYLGGIDPRNNRFPFRRWLGWPRGTLARPDGFINESCSDTPDWYAYAVARPAGIAVPALVSDGQWYPLATLHVHSKKLFRFTSRALEELPPSCRLP